MARTAFGVVAGLTVALVTGYPSAMFISTFWAQPNVVLPVWVTGLWPTAAVPAALFLQTWWQNDVAGFPGLLGWVTSGVALWLSWCAVLGMSGSSGSNALYNTLTPIGSPGFTSYNLTMNGTVPGYVATTALYVSAITLLCLQMLTLLFYLFWAFNNEFVELKADVRSFPGRTCWPFGPFRQDLSDMACCPSCFLKPASYGRPRVNAVSVDIRVCCVPCCGGYDDYKVEVEKAVKAMYKLNPSLMDTASPEDVEAQARAYIESVERLDLSDAAMEDIRKFKYRSWPQTVVSVAAALGLICVLCLMVGILIAQAQSLPPPPGYGLDASAVLVVGIILSAFPARVVNTMENGQTVWGCGTAQWNYLFPLTALFLLWGSAMVLIWVIPEMWLAQGGAGRFGIAGTRFHFPYSFSSHGYWTVYSSTADEGWYSVSVILADDSLLLMGICGALGFFGHVLYAVAAQKRHFLINDNARAAVVAGEHVEQRRPLVSRFSTAAAMPRVRFGLQRDFVAPMDQASGLLQDEADAFNTGLRAGADAEKVALGQQQPFLQNLFGRLPSLQSWGPQRYGPVV